MGLTRCYRFALTVSGVMHPLPRDVLNILSGKDYPKVRFGSVAVVREPEATGRFGSIAVDR